MEKKLLSSSSALTCSDFCEHAEETARIIDGLPVSGFVAVVGFGSVYPVSCGSDLFDIIESMDCKNGVDVFGTGNGYIIRVYGQSVSYDNGETWETETADIIVTR